ncbi:MAG: hypothetical protein J5793_01245 [Clostridia bacterium]|nr:hypothetical protein [Clostridia bacterium]
MNKIWIINIKDKRENAGFDSSKAKFDVCFKRGILAIGWVNYKEEDDVNFKRAINCLKAMKPDDLVWVRNPSTGERFICQITGTTKEEKPGTHPTHDDIGHYVSCKFYAVDDSDLIKFNILKKRLISRPTVRQSCQADLNDMTRDLFKSKTTGRSI